MGRESLLLQSLSMNPQGHSLSQVSFCNSLIALKLNGILQIWNSFFSLRRILLCMNIKLILLCMPFVYALLVDFLNGRTELMSYKTLKNLCQIIMILCRNVVIRNDL